ncbi:hypothetical protein KM043_006354 [Ampulex compressa]|nr:hypothetical protein KM043_006354 [Ampulex compressa]
MLADTPLDPPPEAPSENPRNEVGAGLQSDRWSSRTARASEGGSVVLVETSTVRSSSDPAEPSRRITLGRFPRVGPGAGCEDGDEPLGGTRSIESYAHVLNFNSRPRPDTLRLVPAFQGGGARCSESTYDLGSHDREHPPALHRAAVRPSSSPPHVHGAFRVCGRGSSVEMRAQPRSILRVPRLRGIPFLGPRDLGSRRCAREPRLELRRIAPKDRSIFHPPSRVSALEARDPEIDIRIARHADAHRGVSKLCRSRSPRTRIVRSNRRKPRARTNVRG